MRDFDYHKLSERTWENEILSYTAQIYEHSIYFSRLSSIFVL